MRNRGWWGFFVGFFPRTYPGMGHGQKCSPVSFLSVWLCTASASAARRWAGACSVCLGRAVAGDIAAVLVCLQPPASYPSALMPVHAWKAAANILGLFQCGGGVGQMLSHAAFRLDVKYHCSFDTELSVLRGVVTQLDSNFKGHFSRGISLFPCWVMLSGFSFL